MIRNTHLVKDFKVVDKDIKCQNSSEYYDVNYGFHKCLDQIESNAYNTKLSI